MALGGYRPGSGRKKRTEPISRLSVPKSMVEAVRQLIREMKVEQKELK